MEKKVLANKEATTTRKVINQNGSLYVSLPKKFVKRHEIKAGDFVSMVWGGVLRVIPIDRTPGG
jgi:hypothetical protein